MLDSGPIPMVGQIVPDYELLRRIGRGAYGEVWLARSRATGVLRAAKVVWRHTFNDDRPFQREFEGIQRFERISREHPSQLALFHIGRNEAGGYFYYVMELADNIGTAEDYAPRTLRADLQHGRLPAERVLEIGLALAEALGRLHANGLVHRDVKPSNVIFVNGRPKLADIGLVTDASDRCSIVGTEGYLPPEGPGTPQADIFALGKALYEAATGLGRREFPKLPENLRSWPDAKQVFELNEIILKACAASGKERYQNEAELNADLALLRANQSVREKHFLQRRLRHMRRAGAGLIGVILLGAVPYYIAIKAARVARHEAANASLAKADAEEKLWDSYFHQARAARMSSRLDRRSEALSALQKAAEIRPDPRLRNEAIACLALTELRVAKEWDTEIDSESVGCFDRNYDRFVIAPISNNWISIQRVTDGAEVMRLSGFTPPLGRLRFSPDGRWLAVQHDQGRELVIWALARNQPGAQFHNRNCRTLDFSADGRLAAICFHHGPDTNNPIIIYDLASGQTKRTLDPPSLPHSVCFRPSQDQLAASFEDRNDALIWDLESGAVVERLHHPEGLGQLAWNPTGDLLATVCADYQVYIWDVRNTNIVHILAGHSGIPREVSFSFDGQFLASRGWDGTLRFWDPWSGQQLFKQLVTGFTDGFSGAGYRYGYDIGKHRKGIFELATSQECRLLRPGSSIGPTGGTCHFSQDGKLLLTAHEDGARLWNPATGKVVAFIQEPQTYGALFDVGDDRVVVASEQGVKACAFHRGAAGEISLGQCSQIISHLPAQNLLYAQSMKVFGFSVADKIHLLNRETGATAVLPSAGGASGYVDRRLGLSLHPDGRLLVCGQTDRQQQLYPVRVLDTVTGQLIRELPHDGRAGSQTLFSPNGKWLLTGDNLEYRLWEVGSWRLVYSISRGDTGYAAFMAFSPDSSIIAISPSRDTVRLVEAAAGRELATLEAPEANDIYYLSFGPDGTQLAVVYRYGPIHIWDLRLLRSELAAMNLDWVSLAR